jgi:hypothetical protein
MCGDHAGSSVSSAIKHVREPNDKKGQRNKQQKVEVVTLHADSTPPTGGVEHEEYAVNNVLAASLSAIQECPCSILARETSYLRSWALLGS